MANQNYANSVRIQVPKKNIFDLSHDVKLTGNMGFLIPIGVFETLPGERFSISTAVLIRLMPLVFPMMHRVDATVHWWYCPNSIVWPGWNEFIMNKEVGGAVPAFPTVTIGGQTSMAQVIATAGSLADYLGVPLALNNNIQSQKSAIPFAAYQCIYTNWYRDQNLIAEEAFELVDGLQLNPVAAELITLRRRAWEHDYFTSCLPFAQKGPAVTFPVTGFSDVEVKFDSFGLTVPTDTDVIFSGQGTPSGGVQGMGIRVDTPSYGNVGNSDIFADTSQLTSTGVPITDFREAFALQRFFERLGRVGSRINEFLLGMFGVRSPDQRFFVPQYITGIKQPLTISEVLNTTGTDDAPQGAMAGHGIGVIVDNGGSFWCPEHGFIIGILSVMPKTAYQQGFSKHWLKITDFTDYFFDDFARLSEQPVVIEELYAYTADAQDVFGYSPIYSDYRFVPSRVAGQMATTLQSYHMGRIFDSQPALNQEFIECDATHRVFAIEDENEHKLIMQVHNKVRAIRPIPKFGTPAL